jgi:transposase
VLTGNQQPDHSRISEFRRRNLEALSGLFMQILRLCQEVGMVSLGYVALDGTKVRKHYAQQAPRAAFIPADSGGRLPTVANDAVSA